MLPEAGGLLSGTLFSRVNTAYPVRAPWCANDCDLVDCVTAASGAGPHRWCSCRVVSEAWRRRDAESTGDIEVVFR
jgi:hypothetical protein